MAIEMNNPKTIEELEDNRFYKVSDLKRILKYMGLPYSIYTIRDYETWKCLDYTCGYRNTTETTACERCGGPVRPPLITSPRTRGGGRGPGHRRYSKKDITGIINIFTDRT